MASHPSGGVCLAVSKTENFSIHFLRTSILIFPLRWEKFLLCLSADAERAAASHPKIRLTADKQSGKKFPHNHFRFLPDSERLTIG